MTVPTPAQAATVPKPSAKGIAGSLAKVPKPVWLGVAGIGAGLAYVSYRDRGKVVAEAEAEGMDSAVATETVGGVPEEQMAGAPSPVAYVTTSAPASEPAETVGAVGQTALETMATLFSSVLTSRDTQSAELQATYRQLIEAGKPPYAGPPPTPAPRPVPGGGPGGTRPPARKLPAGWQRGNRIPTKKGGKTFGGALGWKKLGDPSKGVSRFDVLYPDGRRARWHYDYSGKNAGKWASHGTSKW